MTGCIGYGRQGGKRNILKTIGEYCAACRQPRRLLRDTGPFQAPLGQSLDTVVVFASPWGLEELCTTRKFWRVIADELSAHGIASFRFDWPGTGDGRDDIDFSKGLELWQNTLVEAARKARDLSGASRVIIIGQSLGAAVAAETAARIDGIAALALLAPVISGRFYTRELAVWSSMVDADLGLTDAQRIKNSVSIASLTMQPEVAADVKKINLLSLETRPAPQCLCWRGRIVRTMPNWRRIWKNWVRT